MDADFGRRAFGAIDDHLGAAAASTVEGAAEQDTNHSAGQFIDSLNADIVGNYASVEGPYGRRPLVYADWTASGRAVGRIEEYVRSEVLPLFGNTHTTTSVTGLQSTCFRQEARQIVAQAVNARITGKAAADAVIFVGNGTTACVSKLIASMGLHLPLPSGLDELHNRPVVFVSSYEHHSNLLSWRESAADVVTVAYHPTTGVCLRDLHHKLLQHRGRRLKVGSFSACSNVTGLLTATDAVTVIMRRHGGLAFFDYAAAAPYVKMDMNPVDVTDLLQRCQPHQLYPADASSTHAPAHTPAFPAFTEADRRLLPKDGIFFSGHKFVGGPGTPGVLVVKKTVLPPVTAVPTVPGGGSVFYVTAEHQRYLSNREEREESGTPNVLGDVRLGLVVHLKQHVNTLLKQNRLKHDTSATATTAPPGSLDELELSLSASVQRRMQAIPGLVLLGRPTEAATNAIASASGHAPASPRYLPIFSFLIRSASSGDAPRFLHYNFVCALLNDLFGVQSRGGCQCAGPFSQQLLGIVDGASDRDRRDPSGESYNALFEAALLDKHEVLRPGYSRLSFPYSMPEADVTFILDCIAWVARHGEAFLPAYKFSPKTGEWAHHSRFTRFPTRRWLSHLYRGGDSSQAATVPAPTPPTAEAFAELFRLAEVELASLTASRSKKAAASRKPTVASGSDAPLFDRLRWFALQDDDAQTAGAGTEKGPICPSLWIDSVSTSLTQLLASPTEPAAEATADAADDDAPVQVEDEGLTLVPRGAAHSSAALGSAYARQRDGKLPLHLAHGADAASGAPALPRYLLAAVDGGLLAEGVVGAHAAPQPLTTHAAAQAPAPAPAPVIAAPKTEPAQAAAHVDAVDGDDGDDSMLCTSGSCFVKRAVIPQTEVISAASVAAVQPTGNSSSAAPMALESPTAAPDASPSAAPKAAALIPSKKIMKAVGNAVRDWSMIEEGDRLLLGLSGGKDSLTMLHTLIALQKRAPVKFTIACATVDPQTESFDPSPLIPYMKSLVGNSDGGIVYHYLSQPIIELAQSKLQGDSLCAFCSRFKRGLLYGCCREHGYNKLVLAQHLDDLAESFLMSALHNGQFRTMKANYKVESGEDIRVIRPFVYVRESATREFSNAVQLPVINENCPACFEQPKERARIKRLLQQEEAVVPALFHNLRRALLPLMDDELYATIGNITARVEAAGALRARGESSRAVNGGSGEDGAAAGGGSGGGGARSKRRKNAAAYAAKAGSGSSSSSSTSAAADTEPRASIEAGAGAVAGAEEEAGAEADAASKRMKMR